MKMNAPRRRMVADILVIGLFLLVIPGFIFNVAQDAAYYEAPYRAYILTLDFLCLSTFSLLLLPAFCFRVDPKQGDFWVVIGVFTFSMLAILFRTIQLLDRSTQILPAMAFEKPWLILGACLFIWVIVATAYSVRTKRGLCTKRRAIGYVIIMLHVVICVLHVGSLTGVRRAEESYVSATGNSGLQQGTDPDKPDT